MLDEVGKSVEEVELLRFLLNEMSFYKHIKLRDGTWGLPRADNMVSLDSEEEDVDGDEDEDIMIVSASGKGDKKKEAVHQAQPAKAQAPKEKEVDIICLSSDEEDEQLATAIAASRMNVSSASGTPNSNRSAVNFLNKRLKISYYIPMFRPQLHCLYKMQ